MRVFFLLALIAILAQAAPTAPRTQMEKQVANERQAFDQSSQGGGSDQTSPSPSASQSQAHAQPTGTQTPHAADAAGPPATHTDPSGSSSQPGAKANPCQWDHGAIVCQNGGASRSPSQIQASSPSTGPQHARSTQSAGAAAKSGSSSETTEVTTTESCTFFCHIFRTAVAASVIVPSFLVKEVGAGEAGELI